MVSLDQLEKKIYRDEGRKELDEERKAKSEYDPRFSSKAEWTPPMEKKWGELPPSFFQKNKKALIIAGAVCLLVASGSAGWVMYQKGQATFSKEDVLLKITGSAAAVSGDRIRYSIDITNNTEVGLSGAELFLTPPPDLSDLKLLIKEKESDFNRDIKIGEIKTGESSNVILEGRLVGSEKSIHYMEANLVFKPDNLNSRFEINNKVSTTIKDIPVLFSLTAPKQISSGEELIYTFEVSNNTENILEDLEIQWELPPGFALVRSEPLLDKNNIIKISLLEAKESQKISVTGKLQGNLNDLKVVKVTLGQKQNNTFVKYGEDQAPTKISASYVTIQQTVNNSAEYNATAGETLLYKISYKNNSDVGIGEAVVRVKLEGKVLDFKSLEAENASFDSVENIITWKGGSVPELAVLSPNEEGSLEFSIGVKPLLPIESFNDRNFTVKSVAEIESLEIPTPLNVNKIVESNEVVTKVNSKVILKAKAYYNEPTAKITNSGPMPPKVGVATTFTIHWLVSNLANDLENVKITSSLPPNIKWTNQTNTNNGVALSYNERTNEIIWEVGKVPANTGIISPTYEAVFQVALTPAPNQIGSVANILNSAVITGTDTFTKVALEGKIDIITTELPDDSQAKRKGEVIE